VRLSVPDLPRAFQALACALGDAGVGGQQLPALFATGVRATCTGCGLSVSGTELSELAMAAAETESKAPRLPPKLERLRLGYCPRQGCEARYYSLALSPVGRFEPAAILARTQTLLGGDAKKLPRLTPVSTPATRQATRRLALIALAALVIGLIAYRLIYYRSQLIPFVEPKSPFTVDPASVQPPPR
jgi:hypothetical protein